MYADIIAFIMSGRIAERVMPVLEQHQMPEDLKICFIQAKQRITRSGTAGVKTFANQFGQFQGDGPPLPVLSRGCRYIEFQVGADRLGGAGKRRLVFEVQESSGRILKAYYSDAHYLKGTFRLIRMP